MLKFNIEGEKEEKKLNCKLVVDSDGDLMLKIGGESIVYLKQDGKLYLCADIDEDMGLELDSDGCIKVEEE